MARFIDLIFSFSPKTLSRKLKGELQSHNIPYKSSLDFHMTLQGRYLKAPELGLHFNENFRPQ